ncbi:hypothetical protein AB0L66_10735 [Streptomyces sp. NPDC052207]|uniref:hypothetical protein n=1 Tax=Streptomyces sp. NPDC052207 TaxID=3155418 RepID=UPI00341D9CBF
MTLLYSLILFIGVPVAALTGGALIASVASRQEAARAAADADDGELDDAMARHPSARRVRLPAPNPARREVFLPHPRRPQER